MHVPDRITWSFGACEPTNRVVRALSSELIGNEGARVPSLLGINGLFFNQPLPCRALRPAFRILSTTIRCSFSLEICWASKSVAQLIFSIERKKKKVVTGQNREKKKKPMSRLLLALLLLLLRLLHVQLLPRLFSSDLHGSVIKNLAITHSVQRPRQEPSPLTHPPSSLRKQASKP